MNQDTGNAIALLVAGAAVAAFVGVQYRRGTVYGGKPVAKVGRSQDPFFFWIHTIIGTAIAIGLLAGGVLALVASWY